MQVSYFGYPGVDGQYFRCERYGTLSANACGQNFQLAPRLAREGRLEGCVGCPIGAKHSGGSVVSNSSGMQGFCVRCRKSPEDYGGDGVGRVRLVKDGICVSCANREYEVIKGRNAKGAAPKTWRAKLAPRITGLVARDGVTVARSRMAVDRLEVGLAALRRSSAMALCWVSSGILPAARIEQLVLFDGGGSARPPLRRAAVKPAVLAVVQFDLFEGV